MISNTEYHQRDEISKSQLDIFHGNKNGLQWLKDCPVDDEKIETFDFGTACHEILLEPDAFKNNFVVAPNLNMRTNAGKEEMRLFKIEHEAKKILAFDEYKKLSLMRESVMADPAARHWIEAQGVAEGSWFWTDPDTGVECRCRPDKDIVGTRFLMDIKSTDTIKKFNFSVDDYRYYVQDPFYTDGLTANGVEKNEMVFLVMQKHIECGRYPVKCVTLPLDVKQFGRDEYKRDLENLAKYREKNKIVLADSLEMSRNFDYKMGKL